MKNHKLKPRTTKKAINVNQYYDYMNSILYPAIKKLEQTQPILWQKINTIHERQRDILNSLGDLQHWVENVDPALVEDHLEEILTTLRKVNLIFHRTAPKPESQQ